jgi:hypothetical protein
VEETMRGFTFALVSAFTMFAVSIAIGSCGDNIVDIVIDDRDAGPDGGNTGDAGDAGDGGAEGGMSFCPGQCVPLPPDDWQGPRLLWVGPEAEAPADCPPQAPTLAWTGHDGLHADPLQCGPCACDASSGICLPPETFTAHSALCYQGGVDAPFDPPAMWDGTTCTAENAIDAGAECPENSGVQCVQSVTVGKLVLMDDKCQPSFQPPPKILTGPSWDLLGIACKGIIEDGSCGDTGKMCVPTAEPPPPGYMQCVYQVGDIPNCPTEFPFRKVLFASYDDSRHCTACGCDAPQGSLCKGTATVHEDMSCTAPLAFLTVTSQLAPCVDLPPGTALESKTVTGLVYTPGSCQPTGGEPMGQAIPIEPRTFCCMA